MQRIRIQKCDHAQAHYLYDLSLPLPTRRLQRLLFPSALAAAAWLGVKPQRIYSCRSTKDRIWSDAHQSWFAVRIAHEKTEAV